MTLQDFFLSSKFAAVIRIFAFDFFKFAAVLVSPYSVLPSLKTAAVVRVLALDSPELALILLVPHPNILLSHELAALLGVLAWSWQGLYCLRNFRCSFFTFA